MAVAGGYLVAAALAALAIAGGLLPAGTAVWLPLHLALAGGASTAIAGVMPFFVAALSAGYPAPPRLRVAAVTLVAVGAGLVAARGVVAAAGPMTLLPILGGCVYLAGIAATAAAVRAAGRTGLAVRRPIVMLGYSLALVNVAIGASLGTLFVAGWGPVLERWATMRSAHAWANLIGFVSLVIVSTLLHFLPTVLGTRIVPRGSAMLGVLGFAAGAPVVVVGLVLGSGPIAVGGVAVVLVGAGALVVEAVRLARSRGRWTTDPGWHLTSGAGLLAGIGWFVTGVVLASARVVGFALGLEPDAWSSALVGVPLAIGWVVQVLVASWTHLLPSIGPGGPAEHAAQRRILGRGAVPRLVLLNAGVALAAIGLPAGSTPTLAAGLLAAGTAVLAGVVLAVAALRVRVRTP